MNLYAIFQSARPVPDAYRSNFRHLAWYNLALNAAILLGSLAGPFIGGIVGLPAALVAFAILRLLAAAAILRWE
jgi:hypothetical protein